MKPWTGGIHLTSVGVTELDNILGGGQPLGTCILLQEDRWTRDLAWSLLKYWCAEGVCQDHHVLLPVQGDDEDDEDFNASSLGYSADVSCKDDIEDLLLSLPRNLHWAKQSKKEQLSPDEQGLGVLDEDEDEKDEDEGLEIAWQYKKSVQQERLAQPLAQNLSPSNTSNIFCHSYDLSGKLADQTPINPANHMVSIDLSPSRSISEVGMCLFKKFVSLLKSRSGKPVRLVLYHPNLDVLAVALPLFLAYIRKHTLPVVLLVYTSISKKYEAWSKLSACCDVVLKTDGFASRKAFPPPPEFRMLQGILTVSKVSTVTASSATGGGFFGDISISKRPAAFLYGFKRDRRKLHISLLHIPPEDYAQGGGSVGSGVRSGGGKVEVKKKSPGLGCSSNMSNSSLDF